MNLVLVFSAAMLIALIGFFVTRLLPWGQGRGIGRRAVQFLVVAIVASGIFILRLEQIIEDQVFVSLVSAAFGFAAGLAGCWRDEKA